MTRTTAIGQGCTWKLVVSPSDYLDALRRLDTTREFKKDIARRIGVSLMTFDKYISQRARWEPIAKELTKETVPVSASDLAEDRSQ